MKRISTDAEFLDSGKITIDADGLPVEIIRKEYVDTTAENAKWPKSLIPYNTDLNGWVTPGIHWATAHIAGTIINMPTEAAGQAFSIEVIPGVNSYRTQELRTYRGLTAENDVLYRWTLNGTDWSPWTRYLTLKDLADLPSPPQVDPDTTTSGVSHKREVSKQYSRLRRGGVVGTGGATPVALTFDHGFTNFRDKVLPHLIRLGLPCTVAVQPSQLASTPDGAGTGENTGVSWQDMQTWGLNHGIEYAHHAWSHGDVADASTNFAAIEQALTDSVSRFEEFMPETVGDSFIMPGVSGTKWDGFNGGNAPSSWWDHNAGKILLDNFPVISGTTSGYAVPMVGGEDTTLLAYRWSWDTAARADQFMSHVLALEGTGMGIATFMHPSVIDGTDRTSTAKLVEVLEFLAAERDAGRVEVLTLSGFAYADTTTVRRLNLAPASWAGDTATVDISSLYAWARGAQLIVETTATASGPLTMAATSDAGGLDTQIVHEAVSGEKYRLAISVPRSASTLTITAPGTDRKIVPV